MLSCFPLLPSLNKLDLNLPQSPRNSVAYGNLRSNLNTNSACPTSVYTTVNPTTGYRYSGYHNESIYTVETNSSSRMANHQSHQQQQRQMSVVIPEYHEHLRNDLYETKRQLLEETASRKSQKSDTERLKMWIAWSEFWKCKKMLKTYAFALKLLKINILTLISYTENLENWP